MSKIDTAEAKGEARWWIKKALEIAKNMLGKLDIATISDMTGLSVQEIAKLKKNK